MKTEIIYKENGFYSSPLLDLDLNGKPYKFKYLNDILEAVKRISKKEVLKN